MSDDILTSTSFFSEKNSQRESKFFFLLISVGQRIPRATDRTAISLFKHSCINGLLSHRSPPWIQRYAQLLLCCPETECHFRNTPHSTNRIVLQEALQTARAPKLDFPFRPEHSILLPRIHFLELVSLMRVQMSLKS